MPDITNRAIGTSADGIFSMRMGEAPTAAAVERDIHFSKVSLLVGFDGSFLDESPLSTALTTYGTPTIDAVNAALGSGAGSYNEDNGIEDFHTLGTPANCGMDFGLGDFTIEGWLNSYRNHSTWFHSALGNFRSYNRGSWSIFVSYASSGLFHWVVDGQPGLSGTTNIGSGWHHFAVSRNGAELRVFIDGVMEIKNTDYAAVDIGGTLEIVLGGNQAGGNDRWRGLLDEIRVTKGVGRYATDASFTVPTVKYPRL